MEVLASPSPTSRPPLWLIMAAASLPTAAEVIKEGGLKTGVAATGGVKGVYAEGDKRKANVCIYATHTLLPSHPQVATCVILELCVDRGAGARTIHGQWVQQEHAVFITGVYTHVFPIARLYTKGFIGWYRIHDSVFDTLHTLQVDDDGVCNEDCEDYDASDEEAKAATDEAMNSQRPPWR